MENSVRESIQSRKDMITGVYSIPAEQKERVEAFFAGMDALGQGCANADDFEMKFAQSPLMMEYSSLLQALPPKGATAAGAMGTIASQYADVTAGDVAKEVAEGIAEDAARQAKNAVKSEVTNAVFSNIPGASAVSGAIGTAKGIAQLGGLFRKKK
ncbi:MAG: hypothetical protein E7328_05940 [Clostridiales bacterium]|nr:hypothetical protein [Clostridiales bacterium]